MACLNIGMLTNQYTLPSPANLVFQVIAVPQSHQDRPVYQVACNEPNRAGKAANVSTGVTQALGKRPKADDLVYTLVGI